MRNSSQLQIAYGLLAALGLVATWYFNLEFAAAQGGFPLGQYAQDVFANPASSSFGADIAVVVLVFVLWVFTESRRLGMTRPWVIVACTFGVAIAFSFPLFLLLRERRLSQLGTAV